MMNISTNARVLLHGILSISLCAALSGCKPDEALPKPSAITIEFLGGGEVHNIADPHPEFGWVVPLAGNGTEQTAYRILVASDQADLWDSGKVDSPQSINVEYAGQPLQPSQEAWWKVKVWTDQGGEGEWSAPQRFSMADALETYATSRHSLVRETIEPAEIKKLGETVLIDFGKVAFGYLELELDIPDPCELAIHFGEKGDANGIDRNPGGTIRYYEVRQPLARGKNMIEVHPPRDGRNTDLSAGAIPIPETIGVIAPFRHVEIENCPLPIDASMVRQIAIHYPFDETASFFESDNDILNQVWELCKYSIKATSFCGIYVDGDRERIPYEADAYINQLSHYAVDREYSIARHSHEYLLDHSTWPTEWKQHSIMMAWADWMHTGDAESVAQCYDQLKSEKTLEWLAREDGLLKTDGPGNRNDIVDWPEGERDGYDRREINTVINAFHYLNLCQMADLADAIGENNDADEYRHKAARLKQSFNTVLLDRQKGIYIDGEGSTHSALHANMLPLAVGLVPEEYVDSVADHVVSRGMACSVYGAQYLLEGLYLAHRPQAALELMTSTGKRSWYNMIREGSTITMEAWDDEYKPNQDWNHAWGAAPANIVSRYLLGVQPMLPGFEKAMIKPQPAALKNIQGTVPTIRGPIGVSVVQDDETLRLEVEIPANMSACLALPFDGETANGHVLKLDGDPVEGRIAEGFIQVDNVGSGNHRLIFGIQRD